MKQIRIRINDLVDEHKGTFGECKGCSICTEIEKLRKYLERDPIERFKKLLDKGPDMTKSDIALLLENDISMKTIRSYSGLSQSDFHEMMVNYGFSKRNLKMKRRKGKVAKISLEEYQNFKAEGLHDKEIAQKVDMNFQYLSQLKKQWGIRPEINHPAKKKPPMTKTIKADKTIEYEQLIQALRNDLKDAHTQLDEKDEQVQKLEKTIEKYKHIEAACEDVEEELIGLRAENQELQRQLEAAPLPVIETKDDDIINHPNHYHKNGIDVIAFSELQFDEAELKGFYRINCLKYITRFDRKNKIEDLKKADFYLGKLIEMESVK